IGNRKSEIGNRTSVGSWLNFAKGSASCAADADKFTPGAWGAGSVSASGLPAAAGAACWVHEFLWQRHSVSDRASLCGGGSAVFAFDGESGRTGNPGQQQGDGTDQW